jgi:hypothetical protein
MGWVNQSKIPKARHVVMNEMVIASGMETTALINDSNTQNARLKNHSETDIV